MYRANAKRLVDGWNTTNSSKTILVSLLIQRSSCRLLITFRAVSKSYPNSAKRPPPVYVLRAVTTGRVPRDKASWYSSVCSQVRAIEGPEKQQTNE